MKKTSIWMLAIFFVLQCCVSGCAHSDNGKDDVVGEVSTIITTSRKTINTTASNTTSKATTSITESTTADTYTTSESTESKTTAITTVRRYEHILSNKTIKNTYILSTKRPNDLNNHCVVRMLSEQENAQLTNLINTPNTMISGEKGWVKHIPSRPNEYAMAIEFTDDTCMILAIHFSKDSPTDKNWISATMTNDKYDQEAKYRQLEFTRYIASSKLGKYLHDIVFNYNP